MSKAFVRESEVDEDEELVEVQSFPGFKNYMTPAGHRALREEFERLVKVERPQLVEPPTTAHEHALRLDAPLLQQQGRAAEYFVAFAGMVHI